MSLGRSVSLSSARVSFSRSSNLLRSKSGDIVDFVVSNNLEHGIVTPISPIAVRDNSV